MELLEARIKASAIQSYIIAGITLLMSMGLLAGTVYEIAQGQGGSVWFMGVMGLAGVGIAWLMSDNGRSLWPPRESDIYKAVASEPERISWVYPVVGKTNGVVVHLINGHEHSLPANGKDSKALLELLHSRAPNAIYGFGKEQSARHTAARKAWVAAR
jgi:hypothetical protein